MVPSEQNLLIKTRAKVRRLPFTILAAFLLASVAGGCGEEEKHYVANAGASTPTMATRDVSTFISDSGYTRYHLETPVWYIYDDTAEPYWRFPEGLELEQYDNFHRVSSTVVCDSAIYLSRKRLWQLDGNVVMVSTDGDSFLTEQLFWEQDTRRIRSDSFIHIVRSDRTLEGYGFESDQSMKDYIINRPTAILPAQRPTPKKDTVAPDSAPPARRAPAERPSARPAPAAEPAKPLHTKPGEIRQRKSAPGKLPALQKEPQAARRR